MTTFADAIDHMRERIDATARSVEPSDGFPHYADTDTGEWTLSEKGDWTGGFWTGMLRIAEATDGGAEIAEWARKWTEAVVPRATDDTVFRGFLFYYGAASGHILLGDDRAREIAVQGALNLYESFNHDAQVLPLGTRAEEARDVGRDQVNIDGAQAGALLIWAGQQTGDDRLVEAGVHHTLRYIDLFVRDDASVGQSVTIDVGSGEPLRHYTHKGYSEGSTWTRAQAWAMLGFTVNYHYAPERPFLEAAERVSDWWIDHIPDDMVAYWDFDAPVGEETPRDTSGTAIAVASLLKLSEFTEDDRKRERYRDAARATVQTLVDDYLTPVSSSDRRPRGMLTRACYNYHLGLATDHELVWGDYYLFEALHALTGRLPATTL